MSLRNVPESDLVPGVTRPRHVELGTELIYTGPDQGFIWARDADGGDRQSYACHIDDVEMVP
jgi:hypothetical protein